MAERSSFSEAWGFPSDLKSELGADSYEIDPTGSYYKSGRPKYEATFMRGEQATEIARRDAMLLTSKKTGRTYFVVSRHAPAERAQKSQPTLDEFLGAE